MKIKLLLVLFALLSIVACNKRSGKLAAGSNSDKLKTEIDSVSYSLGFLIGENLKQGGITEMNMAAFEAAFAKVLSNDTAKIGIKAEAANQLIMAYFQKNYKKKGDENLKKGEEFLAKNKTEKGVITTASGLQYIVLKEGNGPKPADSSMVKVNYLGTHIDGTEFESTLGKQPAEFPVKGVVPGWSEVLQLMTVGSKYKVFLPTKLAYGENVRQGGKIGPNEVLIFEMELLEILPPQKQQQQIDPSQFQIKQ